METKTRQSNFELLRIISMLMIVAHHLSVHGCLDAIYYNIVATENLDAFSFNRLFVWTLYPGGQIGVALFMMISGYFVCRKENVSIQKVAHQIIFYAFTLTTLFFIVFSYLKLTNNAEILGIIDLGRPINELGKNLAAIILRPVTGGTWWFATTYVLIMLVSPLINRFLSGINKRGFILLLSTFFILYYVQVIIFERDFVNVIRLLFFYLIGAFIRLHCSSQVKTTNAIFYLLSAIILWVAIVGRKHILGFLPNTSLVFIQGTKFFELCICVPLASICIFRFFHSLHFSNAFINKVSSATFGVYLIHDCNLLRNIVWISVLHIADVQILSPLFPLYAILDIVAIYFVCTIIDLLRQRYIAPTFEAWCDRMENKIKAWCCDEMR